jgi:hypothetical protein
MGSQSCGESSGEIVGAAVGIDLDGGVTSFALAQSKSGTDCAEPSPGAGVGLTSFAFSLRTPTKRRPIVRRQITQVIRSLRAPASRRARARANISLLGDWSIVTGWRC